MDWREGGPYDAKVLNDIVVVQAAGYGGGSLIYANVQMRPPADLFDDGWPRGLTRSTLDPYYDLVAHMLDIRPIEPDPATGKMPTKTRLMEQAAIRLGREAQLFRPNIAVRFEGAGERLSPNKFGALQSGCLHCGECDIGCNVRAKNTLDLNYLAVAESLGAEVGTGCEVNRIVPTEAGFELHFRDHEDGRERILAARQVFLCLGAVNTTELLLRCRDQHRTLPRLSPRLGSGYSANGDFLALGLGASPPFRGTHGPTITTACIFDRREGDRRTWFAVEDGGYATYLAHLLPLLSPTRFARLLGHDLKARLAHHAERLVAELEQEGDATALLLVMGRDSADGTIELAHPHHRLHVRWDTPKNLPLYAAEIAACQELVTALGGRLWLAPNWRLLGQPSAAHNLGGCVMAEREEDGVVDPHGNVFGYPGLHVLDGATIPVALGANPSHTIAAVAERCVEAAIRQLPGRERWRAPEAEDAVTLAPPEDRVSIPPEGTAPPVVEAAGLLWRETMRGTLRVEGSARTASVEVTITVANITSFVDDPEHPGVVRGHVHVEGLTAPEGAPICGGSFNLFVEEGDPNARAMRYALPFHASDGRPHVLSGVKDVRGRRIIDFWRATTTLAARLESSDHVAVGIGRLRINTTEVAGLISSLRLTPGGRRRDVPAAFWRFVRFYAATLLKLYAAGTRGDRR
jgi:cholesterol oxidase